MEQIVVTFADGDPERTERRFLDPHVLVGQGDIEEALAVLRPRAEAGDGSAADRLAELLVEQGQIEEAISVLNPRADASDSLPSRRVAAMLVERGRVDEARAVLRSFADANDEMDVWTAIQMAELQLKMGWIEDALAALRSCADLGSTYAAARLADLLAEYGRLEELTQRADAGDMSAALQAIDPLVEQGRIDEALTILHVRAEHGDSHAAARLVALLAEHGRIDDLEAETAAGTSFHQALAAVARPDSALAWLARPKVRSLLEQIGKDARPVTHELLDELPGSKTLAHLRSVLVAAGAVPPRDRAARRAGTLDHQDRQGPRRPCRAPDPPRLRGLAPPAPAATASG